MGDFNQGGGSIIKKYDTAEIEKIRQRNSRKLEELKVHERFEDKKRIVSEKEINRMKEHSYGKWYLKPNDFNKKVNKLNKKINSLNKAFGITDDF